MDAIQKFCSDIEKIKKHTGSESQNQNDSKTADEIKNLFVRNFKNLNSLASSFADFWDEKYIRQSACLKDEPTKENIDKLVAMYSLLDGSLEFTDCLADDDWKQLCSLTTMEAEDLPLDTLNELMSIFVDKKAL